MGFFISFEGIEGCGKTTQQKLLAQSLSERGLKVTITREPGGCPIADKIRGILLDANNSAMTPLAELLLYSAARAQHMEEVIRPAMAAGRIVLCDRFTDATIAYQGYGRELDLTAIIHLNSLATGDFSPQLTVLLDCPVETGLNRAIARINNGTGAREDRFELESIRFHQRVRDGYLKLAAMSPERFIVIDGNRNPAETAASVLTEVSARIPES